ncbi:hypothetical protein AVEN_50700-1 [Araneus ventricosus]|uniref:Uncharacterized protein n=1 Tax=Araneus ventricosus TaxID=182803 RepID=A0A4Y2SET0_ARAVE|nr:hypothetical protein AVEN_50700-1 [Araneus ventricosus]
MCQACGYVEIMPGGLNDHKKRCPRGRRKVQNAIEFQRQTNQNLTPPPSGNSRTNSSSSHPNAGPPSPPHECRGCKTKFTFKTHFDLHCAHCPAVLKKTEGMREVPTRAPLNKCSKCPFVGKNSEALLLHTNVSHRNTKPASLKQQDKSDTGKTETKPKVVLVRCLSLVLWRKSHRFDHAAPNYIEIR